LNSNNLKKIGGRRVSRDSLLRDSLLGTPY
jgi:hypothetical protein